jgi:hypothetical protein
MGMGCHNIFTLFAEKYVDIGSKRTILKKILDIKGFFKIINMNIFNII